MSHISCECGCILTKKYYPCHLKTNKHKTLMKKQEITIVPKKEDSIFSVQYLIFGLDENKGFFIMWDDDNEEVEEIMTNDVCREPAVKKNMLWLEDIKKFYDWKKGDVLYFGTKMNTDGCFFCWEQSSEDDLKYKNYEFIIKEDGLCWGRGRCANWGKFDKIDCLYNDNIEL